MKLLIDGYNLLFARGIVGRETDPGMLARSRNSLLEFVARRFGETDDVTIVFDAREAPTGLSRVLTCHGLTVLFSERNEEADDVLERLIRAENSPRHLTVVSSDHRVQAAARRRGAAYVDCDAWLVSLSDAARSDRSLDSAPPPEQDKPDQPQSADEIEQWLRAFGEQK